MSEMKNNKNVDPNFEMEGGSRVKKYLTDVLSDPKNLYCHNLKPLSITADFRT